MSVMEIGRNSLAVGKIFKRQITKYLNECRNRESDCDGTRSTSKLKTGRTVPPPVPQPDYQGSGEEDEGWDTDFDDDLEEDGNTEEGQNKVHQWNNGQSSVPSQKKIAAMIEKFNVDSRSVNSNYKTSNSVKNDNSSPSSSRAESTPNGRPDLSKRSPLPRPPNLPLVLPNNNSRPHSMVIRPLQQPPPPPVTPKPPAPTPQEIVQEGGVDNYEVPTPTLSDAGSSPDSFELPINTSMASLSLSGRSVSPGNSDFLSQSQQELNCELVMEEDYEIPDGNSESKWSSSSGVSVRSTNSDRPALPPKRPPPHSLVPPPLPEKPKGRAPINGAPTLIKETPLLPLKGSGESASKIWKKANIDSYKGTISNLFSNIGSWKTPNKKHLDSTSSAKESIHTQATTITKSHSMSSLRQGYVDVAGSPTNRPLPAVPTKCGTQIKGSRASMQITSTNSPTIQLLTNSLEIQPWFHKVEREDAEVLLRNLDQPGSYLVRESKRAGNINPYTLTMFYDGKISHLNIRKRNDGQFALGKEKEKEKSFSSVEALVMYHQIEPILLQTAKGEHIGRTCLLAHPEKHNF